MAENNPRACLLVFFSSSSFILFLFPSHNRSLHVTSSLLYLCYPSTRASPRESPTTGESKPGSSARDDRRRSRESSPKYDVFDRFLPFLTPSCVFFEKWDQIWNVLSTIYKTIPLLFANSVPLESLSLFTSWLLRFFLAKPSHFLRWDPQTIDVHFISFNSIYIYCICFVKFWNKLYETKIGILTIISICV